jgi:HK97 family phage portal protein
MNRLSLAWQALTRGTYVNKLTAAVSRLVGWGTPVNDIAQNARQYVKEAFMLNHFVFMVIDFITAKAARVPLKLYKKQPDGTLKEIDKHPLLDLLNKPNTWQGREEFTQQALGYKLITGNSYIYTPRLEAGDNKGKPYELNVMPAHEVEVITNTEAEWMNPIKGYQITWAPSILFNDSEVMHFRFPAYDYDLGDFYGMSPLKPLMRIVNKSNSNMLAAKTAFDNGGASGIITDEATDDVAGLTQEQALQLEKRYMDRFTGAANKGKVLVTVGKLRYHAIGLSPVDMNMITDHQETKRDICATYKLSSTLFNDYAGSTFSNMAEARKAAWTDCIQPLLDSYLEELTRHLCPAYGEGLVIKADYSGVDELQVNKKELVDWLNAAWFIKASAKQEMLGMDADPEMDKYFIPSNLVEYVDLPPITLPDDNITA